MLDVGKSVAFADQLRVQSELIHKSIAMTFYWLKHANNVMSPVNPNIIIIDIK